MADAGTSHALIIVPALDEEETIGGVVRGLREWGYHVLVVSDGSRDETPDRALAAGAEVLVLPINLGVGGALRLGFREAIRRGYRTVVQCDADGQHDPGQVGLLLAEMDAAGLDMVIGSRFADGDAHYEVGATRRRAMRLLAAIARRATRTDITDPTSGFRAIREPLLSEFARSYSAEYLGDTIEALVLAGRNGFAVGEVPVTMRERQGGQPTAGPLSSAWYVVRVLTLLAVLWSPSSRRP